MYVFKANKYIIKQQINLLKLKVFLRLFLRLFPFKNLNPPLIGQNFKC